MNWGRTFFDVDLLTGVSRRTKTFRRGEGWPGPAYFYRNTWRDDLVRLTSQLSAIVKCDAPLATGLERAISDNPSLKLVQATIALRDDLASGMRLADSVGKYPRFFPAWYASLIAAGESTGSLATALSSAADQLMQEDHFRKTMNSWIAYLTFVFFMQAMIAAFLFTYIVPEFILVLDDFNATLPPSFAFVYAMSKPFLTSVFIALGIVAIVWLWYSMLNMLFRHWFARVGGRVRDFISRLPFLGWWGRTRGLADVAAVLERLAAARVPLNEALRNCAALDVSASIRSALQRVARSVEQGTSFSDALKAERGVFPASFVTLLALGETAGRLPEACGHLQNMYRQQALTRRNMLCDVLGPIGVLGLGVLAFAIYGGLFRVAIALAEALLDSL